jgi:O-succinylbenzoic acid--CoA ligase
MRDDDDDDDDDDDALDVFAAARDARDAPAVWLGERVITFGELAAQVTEAHASRARTRVAAPDLATLVHIYAALAARRPLALVHDRLPPAEQQRQRELVAAAALAADTAFVLFTSGSTSAARGVELSRAAVLANARASAAHLGWRAGDRWLLALSTAHAGGLSVVTRCLVARRPLVVAAPDDPRPTLASLVPTQLAALLDSPAYRPPAHLRAVLLGGAAASPTLLAAARARGVPIRATYGLTETFGQVATAHDAVSAPSPLPGVTITTDARGRVCIRGPMLATGYVPEVGTDDGAPIAPELVTADLGGLDAAGHLHVQGRADDVIITGGENVHPAAVEAVLTATPGVRAALAFGLPDERWGQLVGAALAVADVTAFDLAAAAARWRAALPAHALPRRIAVVAALPQLATGKLDRRAAAALATQPLTY